MLAGALVADAVMDIFGLAELEICPWALREGVILGGWTRSASQDPDDSRDPLS